MIIPYIRSSSYNTYDFCELKYFLEYCCGIKSSSTKISADLGNIVHKAFELLSRRKLAEQNGETHVVELETSDTPYPLSLLTPENCIKIGYRHYSEKTKHLFNWTDEEFQKVRSWLFSALEYGNGIMNPANQTIVMPESYFDIEIRRPWAWYSWPLPNGDKIEGYLAIKGTMDLIIKHSDDCYELQDLKTGRRFDWVKSRPKEYKDLQVDPQLSLYMLSATTLYPDPKHWLLSIYFCNDGGVYTMNFDRDDLKRTELMLERRFTKIKNNFRPRAIHPHFRCKWCSFSQNDVQGNKVDSYDQSFCKQVRTELVQLGYDKTFAKHWKESSLTSYEGGGRIKNS